MDNNSIHYCKYCGQEAKHILYNHIWCCSESINKCPEMRRRNSERHKELCKDKNGIYKKFIGSNHDAWNKGLTSSTDPRVEKFKQTIKKRYKDGIIIPHQLGKPLSEETKRKLSESMKRAHLEGRAHNIGESRWNNKPSYPESWFIKVIDNEFVDKNYKREYPFHGFSLDFAWIDKKKCIEIDGEQHQRFEDIKERDQRKNKCLLENGWQYLRIQWKDVFNNTKEYIKICREFIDS